MLGFKITFPALVRSFTVKENHIGSAVSVSFVKHRQVDLVLQSFWSIYRNNTNCLFILGIMGSGMVKNLLNSGHNVTVWNRTTEKVR